MIWRDRPFTTGARRCKRKARILGLAESPVKTPSQSSPRLPLSCRYVRTPPSSLFQIDATHHNSPDNSNNMFDNYSFLVYFLRYTGLFQLCYQTNGVILFLLSSQLKLVKWLFQRSSKRVKLYVISRRDCIRDVGTSSCFIWCHLG